jgi:uncharacterized phiE125 gp8 family phage protein
MTLTNIIKTPVNPGSDAVLTLSEIKEHCEVEDVYTEDDDKLEAYLAAAIVDAENYTGAQIFEKSVSLFYDGFSENLIFEVYPVKSISSIEYYKEGEDVLTVVDPSTYYLVNQGLRVQKIVFKEPIEDIDQRPDALKVVLLCGFDPVPDVVKLAIKLQAAESYERREDRPVSVLNKISRHFLRHYRKY